MPLFGPAHPSPIRVQCDTVDGFLLAYRQNSNLKQVDPFPAVVKYVEKQLKRGKSKKPQKPVKLWKLKLKDSEITGNQLTVLADTLVSHPVISHLDLRNNFIGDKGAVVLLQTMRCQYDAVMHDAGSDHVPGSHLVYQADCNILHKVELEGSGVGMQDASTLLTKLEEHEEVMQDVHRWIELKYVFLKYAENIQGRTLLHQKDLKKVIKGDLGLSGKTLDKAKNNCSNGQLDLELFRRTVAPDYLQCGENRPPLLPRLETQRFSIATQQMILGPTSQNEYEDQINLRPMHQEKSSNNIVQGMVGQNNLNNNNRNSGANNNNNNNNINNNGNNRMLGNVKTGEDGNMQWQDGNNNGSGQWVANLGQDPNRATNGLTVDLGVDNVKEPEPKVEAPSPWSSSFSSFQSSLATAPRGRKHSMTRSTFYAADSSGGGLKKKSSWHKIKKKQSEGSLIINNTTGTKTKKGQDDGPGSTPSTSSPALKKARYNKTDDEEKINGTSTSAENSPQKLTREQQEEADINEAIKRSMSAGNGNENTMLEKIEEQNVRAEKDSDAAFRKGNEIELEESTNESTEQQQKQQANNDNAIGDYELDMTDNNDNLEDPQTEEEIEGKIDQESEMKANETKDELGEEDYLNGNEFEDEVEEDMEDEDESDSDSEWHGVLRFNHRKMTVLKGVGIDWTYLGTKMHTLDLSSNALKSIGVKQVGSAGKLIDTTFPSMPLLKNLNLSKNQIEHLETLAFHLLPSLETIDLSHNKIVQIQGFEANLKLEKLNLENNYIRVIEGIGQLENLETLNISNNRISTVVNLRPLSLNVGLRNLYLQGNPVSFLGRYRPSLISFVPHLDHIDDVALPPSSAQKAARRVAQKLHDSHIPASRTKKKHGGKKKPIMTTPRKVNVYSESGSRSSNKKKSNKKSKKYKEEKKEDNDIVTKKVVDLEEELKLLIFERKEGDKRRGTTSSSASVLNLLSTTTQLVKADAYKEQSVFLKNSGINPRGLQTQPQGKDLHQQKAWIEKMSKPKVLKEKPKSSRKYYGFGAYPFPKNYSPASRSGTKMSDKIASALKVDTTGGEGSGRKSSNNRNIDGEDAVKSPAVPKITLRLAELSTPRAYSSREKSKHQKSSDRPAWGSGTTQRKRQASMYEKQRQKSAGKKKKKNRSTEELKNNSRPGWHTPPISKDMVRSFRREFKDSQQNKNESPALERYAKRQEKLMASQQNILAEDGISIGNIKTAMSSSRMQHNSDGYSDSVGLNSITNGETTIVELIQAVADDTWLSPDQIRTLKKIYNESQTVKQSGKMKKEEIMPMVKSEEELAAVAYLPMKTGYINSDGVEEWTTLFDQFEEIEQNDHDAFAWGELLYFFTSRYIENKMDGRAHTTRKIVKSNSNNGGKTMMRARFSRPTMERRATYTTEDPLALTRMRQWIHSAEQDLASTLSALEMLLRMYEAGDYNSASIRNYRHRLVELEIFEVQGPTSLVRTSMENLEDSNPEIVDDIRNITMKLRDVKAAVKDLLEVMEKFDVGSKEVDTHVQNLMQSVVGKQLSQSKAGEDSSSQLSQDNKSGEDTYQYDNVSVASSLWSLEAQASVKNVRVSQNNLPSNNSIDENELANNNVNNNKNENNDNNASSKPGNNNNNYDSSIASDTSSVKAESRPILLEHEVLHLHVNGAEKLKKVDTFGHSDPYCVVYSNGEKIGKTGIKKNTSKPKWNEVFNISEPSFDLKFDVYDWDRVGSHDYHGRVVINRADIPIYLGRHNVAFELEADPSLKPKKNKNVGGTLFISFSVMNDEKIRKANVAEMAASFARKHSKAAIEKDKGEEQKPSNLNNVQKVSSPPFQQQSRQISQVGAQDIDGQNAVVENSVVDEHESKTSIQSTTVDRIDEILKQESGTSSIVNNVSVAKSTSSGRSSSNTVENSLLPANDSNIALSLDRSMSSGSNANEISNAENDKKKRASPAEGEDRLLLQKGFSKLSLHATTSIENKKKDIMDVKATNGDGVDNLRTTTLQNDMTGEATDEATDKTVNESKSELSKAIRSSMFSDVSDDMNNSLSVLTTNVTKDSIESGGGSEPQRELTLEERIASMLNTGDSNSTTKTYDHESDEDDISDLLS